MQYAELLNPDEAARVHEASAELLESVGILVHSEKARRIFAHHGCRVDARGGGVKFPRAVVEKYQQAFVPAFTFKGRDPQFDKTILKQMVKPQSPNIYAALSTAADMRTGSYAPGAIETGILQMAHSQMAHFYNVPAGGYIGLSGAHDNDAQAGYETGMNITAAMLGRTHMFNTGGLLSSLMAFDYAKAIIDGEMGMMLKRLKRGLDFSKKNLALDVIAEAGHGGSYLELHHTLENMHDAAVIPTVATREMRAKWEDNGRPDAGSRALREVARILTGDNPAVFSTEVDQKIRQRFRDLVPGDATSVA